MRNNYIFTDVTSALPALLRELLETPVTGSRAGRTRELTHIGITLENPLAREVLVPRRKCNIVAQIAETAWVLAGRNDVEWLSHYLPRAQEFSDDGKTWRSGYGPRLRDWHGVDQLAKVVDLLREDPETRRATAVLYDPTVDLMPGKDIACNNWLSFLIRNGALDLHVAVRSNDAMWGWSGINAFEWSVLQEIVAGLVGVEVGQLHFSVTSFHLYERHWERAEKIYQEAMATERVRVEPSPRFGGPLSLAMKFESFNDLLERWFMFEYDIRTGSPLVQGYIDNFPEPMLRSWLQVLDWWWNGRFQGTSLLWGLQDTALVAACNMGLKPPWDRPTQSHVVAVPSEAGQATLTVAPARISEFLTYAIRTHNDKHAAYGDSWKRRGEMLGIMANIARKIDRLGGGETADETSADTAMDLMIYLAKYRVWLGADPAHLHNCSFDPTFTADATNELLIDTEKFVTTSGWKPRPEDLDPEQWLIDQFDRLEDAVSNHPGLRVGIVDTMLPEAYALARRLFEAIPEYRGADYD